MLGGTKSSKASTLHIDHDIGEMPHDTNLVFPHIIEEMSFTSDSWSMSTDHLENDMA